MHRFALLLAAPAALATATASAQSFSAVGFATGDEAASFRSTSVPKSFSVTGVDAYGTAGYQLFVTGDVSRTDGNEFNDNGQTEVINDTLGDATTLRDLPAGVTVGNAGASFTFLNFGNQNDSPLVDDPSAPIADTVSDVRLGSLFGPGLGQGVAGDLISLTFGEDAADSYRIGVLSRGGGIFQANNNVSVFTDSLEDAVTVNVTSGDPGIAFFDVSGITAGDSLVIRSQDNGLVGGGNPAIRGVVFDVVPEPSALALTGVGALALLRRRGR